MTTTTKPRSLRNAYPSDLTPFIVEAAGTAMRAIIESDPTRYIQEAVVDALESRRLERGPALALPFRYDAIRNRVIRDLAMEIVEAYERLKRAENTVSQIATSTTYDGTARKDASDPARSHVTHTRECLNEMTSLIRLKAVQSKLS